MQPPAPTYRSCSGRVTAPRTSARPYKPCGPGDGSLSMKTQVLHSYDPAVAVARSLKDLPKPVPCAFTNMIVQTGDTGVYQTELSGIGRIWPPHLSLDNQSLLPPLAEDEHSGSIDEVSN